MKRRYLIPVMALFGALKAVKAQTPVGPVMSLTMRPQLEVFRNTSQSYTLAQMPVAGTREMVFVNGLLMSAGDDYTLTSRQLNFASQIIGSSPCIQVQYWTAA